MSRIKILFLKLINRWVYPYPVMIEVKGVERYAEIYDWLKANVGNMDDSVWCNITQRTWKLGTNRLRYTEILGELRFKDQQTATLFKLTFQDEISG